MKRILLLPVVLLLLATVQAQTNKITGFVIDPKGNPLAGVSVAVKGTQSGTLTDSSGRFEIRAHGPGTVLIFSLVSYETKEEAVGKRIKLEVVLNEANSSMNDVVVIGYGTQRKRDLTGAITTISSKQLEERHTSSLGDALQGLAAGVLVTTAAEPGAQPTIQIRGYSTFSSAGNTPLYVIDGILSDNMSWVNPNDVQSVEILKDAASAAIYGSRSANGVIIITTKRGVEGKPRIGVQYLHVSGELAHKLPQANSKEVRLYRNEQGSSGVSTDSLNPSYNADNDYQSVLTRIAARDQVDFSASGASKNTNFYTSIRALDDQGLIYNSYAKSLFFRTNIEFSPSSRFRYFGRMQFGYTTGNVIDEGNTIFQAFQRPPNYALYNPDGSLTGYISGRRNPLTVVLDQVNLNQNYNGSLFNQVDFAIIPELKLTANAVATYTETRNQQFLPKILSSNNPLTNSGSESFSRVIDWQAQSYLNYSRTFGGDHLVTLMAGTSAESSQTNGANESAVNYVNEQVLTLNSGTIVPNGTTTTATADSRASLFGRATYGYKGRYLFATTIRRDGSSRFGPDNRWGDFLSASAAWRFSDEHFMHWSAGFLDDAKFRFSYGQTGNESIGDYTAQTTYNFGNYYYNGISGIAPSTTLGNPTLQWEATTQQDAGLDLSFFRSRLLVVADVYVKKTNNLLTQSPLPAETGFSNYEVNYGSIRNRGFELSIIGRPILRRDFDWSITYNLSVQKGVVTQLNAGLPAIQGNSADAAGNAAWLLQAGQPLGNFYGWRQLRVYPYDLSNAYNAQWQPLTPDFDQAGNFTGYNFQGKAYTGPVHSLYGKGVKLKGGDVEYQNLNGDSVIDNNDRQILGNAQPKFFFAVMNTMRYKKFSLSFTVNTQWGDKVYNNAAQTLDNYATSNIIPQPDVILHMWRHQGDVTQVPAYLKTSVGDIRMSNRFLEDGSFIRLAYAQLNYTFPIQAAHKIFAQAANAYIYGSNLLMWTNYSWYDPELISTNPLQMGQDNGSYPRRRELGIGLNITF